MNVALAYTLFGATASALVTAALFITYLRRLAVKEEEAAGCEGCITLRSEMEGLRQGYDTLRAGLHSLETTVASTPSGYTVRPSLNLAKRSRILRQHRRGESAKSIAMALDVPRAEVDLLLKIHQLELRNPNVAGT